MYKKLLSTLSLLILLSPVWAQEDETDESAKRPSWSEGLPERQSAADLNKPDFKPEIDNDIELDMSEFGIKPKAEIEIELPISAELPDESAEQPAAEPAAEEAVAELPDVEIQQPAEQPPVETQPAMAESESPVEESVEMPADEPATDVAALTVNNSADVAESSISEEPAKAEPEPVDEAVADAGNEVDDESMMEVDDTLAAVEPPVSNEPDPVSLAEEEQAYVWTIIKQTPVEYPVKAAIDNLEGWVEVEVTINANGEVVSATPVNYSRRGRIFGKPAVQSVYDWLFDPPANYGIEDNVTRVYKIEFNL